MRAQAQQQASDYIASFELSSKELLHLEALGLWYQTSYKLCFVSGPSLVTPAGILQPPLNRSILRLEKIN